jgi:hypothetical protein
MGADEFNVDTASDHRLQRGIRGWLVEAVETPMLQVRDTRRELQSCSRANSCLTWMPADQPTRAKESINVLRLMPNVRQTAALVAPASNAAITAASFSASTAAGRPRRRAAARPA